MKGNSVSDPVYFFQNFRSKQRHNFDGKDNFEGPNIEPRNFRSLQPRFGKNRSDKFLRDKSARARRKIRRADERELQPINFFENKLFCNLNNFESF